MTTITHKNNFRLRICDAMDFMETHPGGRNRRLTAEERDGKPWVSVAMNFPNQDEALKWAITHIPAHEREGDIFSNTVGYYKATFPWGLVYAHFPKVI